MKSKSVEFPKEYIIDEDMGYFIGLYLGDGMVDYQSLRFFYGLEEISFAEKTKKIIESKFKCENVNIIREKNIYVVRSYNVKWLKVFEKLKLKGNAHTKKIPDYIFNSPNSVKAQVIKGLFDSDGHIRRRENHSEMIFSSVSEELANKICLILDLLGVNNCIRKEKKEWLRNSKIKSKPRFIVTINDYESIKKINDLMEINKEHEIKIKGSKFKLELNKTNKKSKFKIIPTNMIDRNRWKISIYRNEKPDRYGNSKLNEKNAFTLNKAKEHTDQKFIHQLSKSNINFATIKSMKEKRYIGDVYDIEVKDNHNFLTYSGIFTSNCRWRKSMIRESVWALKNGMWERNKFLTLYILFNLILPFMFVSLTIPFMIVSLLNFNHIAILQLIFSILMITLIRDIYMITEDKNKAKAIIPFTLFNIFVIMPIWLWALFTQDQVKWGTR